jgi:DNA modification methylase
MAEHGLIGVVEEVPVGWLRPWPEQLRTISPERLAELKLGLRDDPEMLWARPLLVLPDGTVVGGNQRLRAVRELGWERVPVVVAELGWERARLWALRDNAAYGVWEEEALGQLLAELAAGGVDLALTGFGSSELDRLLAGFRPDADPDDAPPPPVEPESVPGETYRLGPHRLLCGDATERRELEQFLAGERAEVLWTDPPYGVDYRGKTSAALEIRNDDPEGLADLLGAAFAAADAVLAPSARFYIACPGGVGGLTFRQAVADAGWLLHQDLVWVKHAPTLGHADHHHQHETVLYGWKSGPGRPGRGRHRGSRWYGDNRQTTVFHVDRPVRSTDHPVMKPVALVEAMLMNSSRRGDIILDPFAGSGTTLIACERLGRRCFAVELDPAYCDVIRRRYEEYTRSG